MAVGFWYRQSPETMVVTGFHSDELLPGIVTTESPPPTTAGMVQVDLDPQGRLTYYLAIPPQLEDKVEPAKPVDWNPLFAWAGIDPAQLKPADPIWNSLASSDTRVAWTGAWPGSGFPLRVEAAALHGQPVFFSMVGPWTRAGRQNPARESSGQDAAVILLAILLAITLVIPVLLARSNYLKKRGDPQGAFRLAVFVFFSQLAYWACNAHFVPTLGSFGLFVLAICGALFLATLMGVLYLALEPIVRRRWPHSIISWSRLLLGRWRDPLVGRDVLFGLLIGLFWCLLFEARIALTMHLGDTPDFPSAEYLHGARYVLGRLLREIPLDIRSTLGFFFLLFLVRVALRKTWLTAVVFVALWVAMKVPGSSYPWIDIATWGLLYATGVVCVVRFGLVSLTIAFAGIDILLNVPWTADLSSWFIGAPIFAYTAFATLGIWAFYTALAGQKLWKGELFE
jgi:serine/threonine-protein kinase